VRSACRVRLWASCEPPRYRAGTNGRLNPLRGNALHRFHELLRGVYRQAFT
jgi:hypothetical protein